jgi:hypothetical protein
MNPIKELKAIANVFALEDVCLARFYAAVVQPGLIGLLSTPIPEYQTYKVHMVYHWTPITAIVH